jgi:hypothetical protein
MIFQTTRTDQSLDLEYFEKGSSGSVKIQILAQHWFKLPTVFFKKK